MKMPPVECGIYLTTPYSILRSLARFVSPSTVQQNVMNVFERQVCYRFNQKLLGGLLRFRQGQTAFSVDVEAKFHLVKV